ncbi:hypothetical protein A2U01_0091155, partial [Trifolium medium]|nr:hypothetical protein [Trifolium medium]
QIPYCVKQRDNMTADNPGPETTMLYGGMKLG